jgi:hypothetical protein
MIRIGLTVVAIAMTACTTSTSHTFNANAEKHGLNQPVQRSRTEASDSSPQRSHDARGPAEMRAELVSLLRTSEGGAVRQKSLIEYFARSGPSSASLAAAAASFEKELKARNLIGTSKGCFKAGCYFDLRTDSVPQIVSARESSAPGYNMIITHDKDPYRMLVLLEKENM